jgi:hypothetical protein
MYFASLCAYEHFFFIFHRDLIGVDRRKYLFLRVAISGCSSAALRRYLGVLNPNDEASIGSMISSLQRDMYVMKLVNNYLATVIDASLKSRRYVTSSINPCGPKAHWAADGLSNPVQLEQKNHSKTPSMLSTGSKSKQPPSSTALLAWAQ